jgi:hypothetical protein
MTPHPPPAHAPDVLDVNEWVQNALQLSGYFIEQSGFAMARSCLEAVRALLEARAAAAAVAQAQEQQQGEGQQQQEDATGGSGEASSGGGGGGGGEGTDADAAAPDAAGGERRRTDQQGPAPGRAPAAGCLATAADAAAAARAATRDKLLAQLDADVAANVALGWGKWLLYRLAASHDAALLGRGAGGAGAFASPEAVPAAAR